MTRMKRYSLRLAVAPELDVPDAVALPALPGEDGFLDLRTDLVEQTGRRRDDQGQVAAALDIHGSDVDQHQEEVHVAAVAAGGVLVQVNRGIGQVPDLVAVAVALPEEVGVLGDVLAAEVGIQASAGDAGAGVGNAVLLDFAVDQAVAGGPAVARILS